MLVVTVDIRNRKSVSRAARRVVHLGDVGDPRVERAAHAGELLVDLVGDLVRHPAHQLRRCRQLEADHLLAPQHVVELELDDVLAVERGSDVADDKIIGAEQPPVLEVDLGVPERPARQAVERDRFVLAGSGQIVGDNRRDVGRRAARRRAAIRTGRWQSAASPPCSW